jgi:hydrolase
MQLQGTNTYLLGSGDRRLLIDTGEGKPRWANLISATVAEKGISIEQVLLTHWHGDHTGGVPDLVKRYPHLQHAIFKYDPDLGQQPIVDGQVFSVEGATVRAIYTPGHSTDHVCFLLEEENALFTGDNILGHGTTVVEDLAEYLRSLYKMQAQDCVIGYPGHGAVIEDLRYKLKVEVSQKHRRERQVLMGLKSFQRSKGLAGTNDGRATVAELVVRVFGRLPPSVRESVFEPFMSELLMKLANEKRVGFEFKGGQKRWFSKV